MTLEELHATLAPAAREAADALSDDAAALLQAWFLRGSPGRVDLDAFVEIHRAGMAGSTGLTPLGRAAAVHLLGGVE